MIQGLNLQNLIPDRSEPVTIGWREKFLPHFPEEGDSAGESSVSIRGKILTDFLNHFTHDMALGRMVQTGEIRKRIPEPEWKVPECFVTEDITMPDFSMKLLSSREEPRTDRIILQLHGGGYVGAVRNKYYVFAGLYNEVSGGCSVLTPDYRVAPENPFPAALADAMTAYAWLLGRGWQGRQIILAGDSAGGGLAMSMTMLLRQQGMPLPGGIIAMSPWTDLTASGESYETNFTVDPLFGNTKESMIYDNPYPGEQNPADWQISPLFGDFSGFPPMLVQVGSLEMLLSDAMGAAEKARSAGCRVRLSVYEGMFHVFQMAYLSIPESRKAWSEVGRYFQELDKLENPSSVQ